MYYFFHFFQIKNLNFKILGKKINFHLASRSFYHLTVHCVGMSEDVLEVRKSTTAWNAHSSLLELQTLKLSLARSLALSRSLSLSLACACKTEDL